MDINILSSLYVILFVLFFLILGEVTAKKQILSKEDSRKLIHISVGNMILFVPLFTNRIILTAIPAIFIFGNYMLSPKSPIGKMRLKTFEAGHALGTVYYSFSLTLVVWFGFGKLWLIAASFLPLVFGDGFAAVFGPKAKNGKFQGVGGEKTLLGSSMFVFFAWFAVSVYLLFFGYSFQFAILVAIVASLISIIVELLSPRGLDNLLIPLINLPILYYLEPILQTISSELNTMIIVQGIIFGMFLAIVGYFAGALTVDGAVTGFLLGILLFGMGGWTLGLQLFFFFILGSIATKISKKRSKSTQDEFEKGGTRRDSTQALAKAGIAAILTLPFLFTKNFAWFYFISAILTSSLVDTMATELGILSKQKPRLILKPWKIAEPGVSGGVSTIGSLGGLIFGVILSAITYGVSRFDTYMSVNSINWKFIILVPIAGFIGMLMDGIIGSTLQRENKCQVCGKIVESKIHCNKPTQYHKGLRFINNDMVNLLATTTGGLFGYLFYILFI